MKKHNLNKVLFFLFFVSITNMAKSQEVSTEIIIKSDPQTVWNVLTDFKDYPNWNPYIIYIEGELKSGKKLNVTYLPPKEKEYPLSLKLKQ